MIMMSEIKTYEDKRTHFRERLLERCGIEITEDEYDNICTKEYVANNYKGLFKKKFMVSYGRLNIKGQMVIAMFDGRPEERNGKTFLTVFNISKESNADYMLRICFGESELYKFARNIYWQFVREFESYRQEDKPDIKTVAKTLYLEKGYIFAPVFIDYYLRGEFDNWRICRIIRDIIFGYHKNIKLTLTRDLPVRSEGD